MEMPLNSSVSLLCFKSPAAILIFMSYVIAYVLFFLPLLLLIVSSRSRSTSYSDFFTYNVIGLELVGILGSSLYSFGAFAEGLTVQMVGVSLCSVDLSGQTLFHLLTCVERYLAVIHPVTYLALKRGRGCRVRTVSAGCVWLVCVGLDAVAKLMSSTFLPTTHACLMVFSLVVVSLSGFSILAVLNNPGPGQASGGGRRVDPAKLRAFHTVAAIMAALLLRFAGVLLCNIMFTSPDLNHTRCAVGASAMWLTLPCSLVLPLLFLQRAGRLPGCRRSSDEG